MLLIIADKFDIHADLVQKKLMERGVAFYRLDLDTESLRNTFVSFDQIEWLIENSSGLRTTTKCIKAVWCRRPFVEINLEEQSNISNDFKIWKNEWNRTLLGLYNTLTNLPWLNPLRKAFQGENKYFQMSIAADLGLKMPSTLISNRKSDLVEFAKKYPYVVLKVMEQAIYKNGEGEPLGIYANKISADELEEFSEKNENPIFLQEYIEKDFEVRYTVVGKQHLVCKIESQKSKISCDDWRRYDLPSTPHSALTPPSDIKEKVENLMTSLDLEYGGLDFIVTPAGEWIFLEINCMGQWLWIEQLTALPISDSIADWIEKSISC
jgi:glutathione synthase/RimK-type ligase-like ATP-grasp enzyme